MKQITYGFYVEDEPQRIFLENYLLKLPLHLRKPEVQFVLNDNFYHSVGWGSHNRNQVDSFFAKAGIRGFLEHSLDLYFVGRDCDHHNDAECNRIRQIMESQLLQWQNRTIAFVPVQCIEHWLLYLKRRQDNPVSGKNETLEFIPREKAKIEVYDRKRFSLKHSQSTLEDLLNSMDIDWLEARCGSFKAFHQKTVASVTQFLA